MKLNDCSRHSAYNNGRGRRVQIHRKSNHPKLYFYPNQPLPAYNKVVAGFDRNAFMDDSCEFHKSTMICNILLSRPSNSNLMCLTIQLCSVIPSHPSGQNHQKEIWCCQVENFPNVIQVGVFDISISYIDYRYIDTF